MTSRENGSLWGRRSYPLLSCALLLASLVMVGADNAPPPNASTATTLQDKPVRPDKLPEDWTLEERLTWRFDPDDARRRRDEDARESGRLPDLTDDSISVEGRTDPELLLPTELFDALVTFAVLPHPQAREGFQRTMIPALQGLGFDDTFWATLETAIPEYYSQQKELRRLAMMASQASENERARLRLEMEDLQRNRCRDRFVALAKARAFFGGKRFDRVLYRAVAPLMNIAEPNERYLPGQLRQFERGECS